MPVVPGTPQGASSYALRKNDFLRQILAMPFGVEQGISAIDGGVQMQTDGSGGVIVHAIQLAIAPVFLLTGIAGLLGVMANRLARIIDRARVLEQTWANLDEKARLAARAELGHLEHRRNLASWAINFCAGAALLLCIVIITLFVEEFFRTDLKWLAGVLFIAVMIALIGGLSCFLREVYLATHTGRIEMAKFERSPAPMSALP